MTDLAQLPSQANVVSNGLFWSSMVWLIWAVIFLSSMAFGFELSLLGASFVGLVLSILLVYAGLASFKLTMTFSAIILIYFLYIIYTSSRVKQ